MTSYDPRATLHAISANAVPVVLVAGLSILAMFVFFVEAARMGARDRVYPMALCVAACAWAVVHLRQVWLSGRRSPPATRAGGIC